MTPSQSVAARHKLKFSPRRKSSCPRFFRETSPASVTRASSSPAARQQLPGSEVQRTVFSGKAGGAAKSCGFISKASQATSKPAGAQGVASFKVKLTRTTHF